MLVGVIVGSMIYKAITPPPFKVLNSPDGPKVTAPRIEMRDGRYLAYKETGVKRERASHYIIHVHGYGGSRLLSVPIPTVSTLVQGHTSAGCSLNSPLCSVRHPTFILLTILVVGMVEC